MNPAGLDMIEATLEQVRGKAARGIVVQEDRTAFDDLVAGVFRGERRSLVFGVTGLKGGRRTLETLSVPLRGPGGEGEVTALLSVTRDITERKAMEERLRQTEKMEAIGLLAGGVAHDFNNMLLAILGNAELMVSRAKDPEIRSYAEAVVSSAQRSTSLTRKLLAFARRGKYQVVPVDVHSVINDVIDLLGHSIDKRITVERRLEASCPVVQGDPPQVHNALLNLALNACDAMPNGGTLTFTTGTLEKGDSLPVAVQSEITTPGRLVRIDVQDTGTGFTEDARSHLFEPFFTTKPPGEGTGLGLASVYGTVKTHGGALSVESAPGLGTVFSVFLPAAPQIESPETEPVPEVSVPTRETTRILVIEDESLLRRLLQAMLHTIGYEAVLAADGSEGVENYRREWKSIDLVLLDVIMPVMGGYDTLVELKKVNPGVKAIVTSGYALDDDVRRILDLGAVGFVQKPFRMPDLLAEISKALGPESHCL
jgi:PAS domain S-box-containing protein